MKELGYRCQNLRDLCKLAEIIDPGKPLVYTEIEMLSLLEIYIREQAHRLEKGRRMYKDAKEELDKLKSPQLWRWGSNMVTAPPDYKAEYMRRYCGVDRQDNEAANGIKTTVRTDKEGKSCT